MKRLSALLHCGESEKGRAVEEGGEDWLTKATAVLYDKGRFHQIS
jgi:hypothetical protein